MKSFGMFGKELLKSGLVEVAFHVHRAIFSNFGSGIDATGRKMAPGSISHETNPRYRLRKKGIALHGFSSSQFAGINIRSAGVSCGVEDKLRLRFANVIEQNFKAGIVDGRARQRNEAATTPSQLGSVCLAEVAGGT